VRLIFGTSIEHHGCEVVDVDIPTIQSVGGGG
jgi:hypothetical protein